MSKLGGINHPGNPIVNAVLDQILDVSQIDPSVVSGNYKLQGDLGLSRSQTQQVLFQAARQIGLNIGFEICRVEDMSCKEMVDLIGIWAAQTGRNAA